MATKTKRMATKTKSGNKNAKSASDLLSGLNKGAKKAKKPTAKERNTLDLPKDVQGSLVKWVEAKLLSEVIDSRLKNKAEEVKEACLELMLEHLWEHGSLPGNPSLKLNNDAGHLDIQAIYILQKKFKIRIPVVDDESPEETAARILVDAGLSEENAENLVEAELDMTPQTGVRPLNELVDGHYGENKEWIEASADEQEAGRKLLAFLTADSDESAQVAVEALTDDERDTVIRRSNKIVVRAGFYERVKNYCTTPEQLTAVFQIVQPVHYPSRAKLGISDTERRKNERLAATAADILGVDMIKYGFILEPTSGVGIVSAQ